MGYRIRYQMPGQAGNHGNLLLWQAVGAAVLGLGLWMFGGMGWLRQSGSLLEQATGEMAAALVSGDGWREGLLRFCGRIIHGPY